MKKKPSTRPAAKVGEHHTNLTTERKFTKSTLWVALAFTAVLALLTYAYLLPGSSAMIEGRTDTVMSDGSDPAALPYIYDQIYQVFKNHPSHMLYGSVYIQPTDPEKGYSCWSPWSERWIAVVAATFLPMEQISTAVVCVMLMLNALAMLALARYLGWNRWLALGAAIAWAFTPFTRARAKVHMAMAGTFHLPLIFLALLLITRGRSWRSLALAAVSLWVACTTVHYFVVTSLFLTPLFLLFFALQPETRANWKRAIGRLSLAALPAVLFLAFCFAFPIPPDAKVSRKDAFPKTGETTDGGLHPYLTIFAAKPIDYLGGDIALLQPASDLNPLRQMVNDYIMANMAPSNPHERSNGIRWSLLIVALVALVGIKKSSNQNRTWLGFFLGFSLFGFWLSLPPGTPVGDIGPSGWLFTLVSQVRVPSRAGILVAFGVLMIAGTWLNSRKPVKSKFLWPLFPLLMILDYPPLPAVMPMSPLLPAYPSLQRSQGPCGPGMYFPWVDNYRLAVLHYTFLQQMRGSDCPILNGMTSDARLAKPATAFPPVMEFLSNLDHNLVAGDQLEHVAHCVPLDWIAFDPHVSPAWRDKLCAHLGWRMTPGAVCVSGQRGRPLERYPDQCL